MYNILSVQTHTRNIRNIFLTTGKQISWLFQQHCFYFMVAKRSSNKVYEKMKNNSTLKKVLLMCNINAELLRLLGATFDSKVAFLRRMKKKSWIILKRLHKKNFVCRFWHLSYQISIENVRKIVICSLNVLMSVVFKIFLNICICILTNFDHLLGVVSQTRVSSGNRTHDPHTNSLAHYTLDYQGTQLLSNNFIWNIDFNNGVYCNLRNKSVCLNTILIFIYIFLYIITN